VASLLALAYSVTTYVLFAAVFLYSVGFVGGMVVPKSIDSGAAGPAVQSLIIDILLLGVFAVQHSVMARRGFKRWWTRIVPAAAERSTYVLAATLALALLLWQWQPIPAPVVWSVQGDAGRAGIEAVFWLGWGLLLASTFLLNHFELFGLSQPLAHAYGRPIAEPTFRTPLFYRYVRHPLYLGFLLAFWATPVMSAGHLLFALGATGYILLGIWFEERDLVHQFGAQYRAYRAQVGMLVPWRKAR
jgi:methanethiol S-methyltransferase